MLDPRLFDDDDPPSRAPFWLAAVIAVLMGLAIWGVALLVAWLNGH